MLVERALEVETTEHLGRAAVTNAEGNTRNGDSGKTLKGDFGELPLEIPRDRQGLFEPQTITSDSSAMLKKTWTPALKNAQENCRL